MANQKGEKIGFALGGLAGNNAHGAGFLQAALDVGAQPDFITCTSGQILWVQRYLEALDVQRYLAALGKQPQSDVLKDKLQEDIDGIEHFHQRDLDLFTLALSGKPGIFRAARYEYPLDFVKNTMSMMERVIKDWPNIFFLREWLDEWPARTMVPLFKNQFFEEISKIFNGCNKIGIAFNSYDPSQGMEIVHLNEKAQIDLKKPPGYRQAHRSRTLYKNITPPYVKNALWIYQYGFEDSSMLDGAFYRQIMLSELTPCDVIFVARPINYKWLGKLPSAYIEMEDMKTEVSFNGSYQGERDKIELINKLIKKNNNNNSIIDTTNYPQYHHIQLEEIEMETQESFFDYVFEDMRIFDKARQDSYKKLQLYFP